METPGLNYPRKVLGRALTVLFFSVALAAAAIPADARTHPRPNLRELRVSAPARTLVAGATFTARDRLKNVGRAAAKRSSVAFFLSRDARSGRDDLRLGARAVKPLRAGRTARGLKRLRLPAAVATGRWRVIACADPQRRVRESSERDNCAAAAGALTVAAAEPGPDPGPGGTPRPDPGGTPGPPPGPDSQPPTPDPVEVTLLQPDAGAATNAAAVTFSGSAAPGALVSVRVYPGNTPTGSTAASLDALPAADGTWSADAGALADGTYTAQATQTDSFGRTQTSPAHTFRVDRVRPGVSIAAPGDGSTTADTTPTISGAAGSATGDAATVTVRLYEGNEDSEKLAAPPFVVDVSGGAFAATPDAALVDGLYTARAEQVDDAGNVGMSAAVSFQVDHIGPTVNLVTPPSDSAVKVATFSGTAGDNAGDSPTVTITVRRASDNAVVRTLTPTRSGTSFSATASPALADGSYVARAEQSDGGGNTGTSAPHPFRVDTVAPAVTITAPADTKNPRPSFSGGAGTATGDSDTVTVTIRNATTNAVAASEAVQRSGGSWSLALTSNLPDGSYNVRATQTDSAGNSGSSAQPGFKVDTQAPSPTIGSPAAGATVTSARPTLTGTAGAASGDSSTVTVKLYAGTGTGGTLARTLTATRSGGTWSVAPGSAMAAGTYTAVAEQSDALGNAGQSGARTFTIDPPGPNVSLTQPLDATVTKDATPTFAGTAGTGPDDLPGVTVKIYAGSTASGTPVQTRTTSGSSWSIDASPALADGTYAAQAEQSDSAGNVGTSVVRTFRVDTVAPAVTIANPADTKNPKPGFSGNAGAATGDSATVTLTIRNAGTNAVVATQNATRSGSSWSVNLANALPDGSYTAQATQTDSAGNGGASSQPGFKVDTQAPAPTITSPAAGATVTAARPTLSGTAGSASGDSNTVTVKLYAGTGTGGTLARTLTATRSGGTWSVTAGSAVSAGTYTAVAQQQDALGNAGESAPRTFTVDPPGPNVTLTSPAPGTVTGDSTPAFSGASGTGPDDLPGVTVKIYSGGSATGTPVQTRSASGATWSVSASPALADGTYTAQAEQQDSAGNTGRSSAVTFSIDSASPTLTLTLNPASPNGDNGWYTSMPTVHVVADSAHFGSLSCTVDGSSATVTPTPGSSHSAEGDVPVSGDGSHTVSCTATDTTGNPPATKQVTFKVDRAAPTVALTTPANGATATLMTFTGSTGSEGGDVTLKVWSGTDTSGTLVRSQSKTPSGGAWSLTLANVLDDGQTYTARAEREDAAGNVGRSAAHTFMVPETLQAAGDIASCDSTGDEATAGVVAARSGTVAALGDDVYADGVNPEGSLANFQHCYEPSWGPLKPRTRPAIGNHEYNADLTGTGYFDYFNGIGADDGPAGPRGKGYYSYDKGSWHIVVLNTNNNCQSNIVSCSATSPQVTWLKSDLAAHPAQCTVAYFHHPRFSSYLYGDNPSNTTSTRVKPIWDALYAAGADLVLNGHAHNYERYRPLKPDGTVDDAFGIREFIAGEGGASHHSFSGARSANSLAFDSSTYGILELRLNSGGYSWQFVPAPGQGPYAGESGSASCHGAPPAP